MKKFKKVLLSILSLALVAILSIGGTLAYLTSEDSDVNVMTMGNVKIAQHEYERATNEDGSYKTDTIDNQTSYVLKEFTQDKPLYPAVADPHHTASGWDSTIVRMTQVDSYGSMQVFAEPNAQDKFVTVENTGRSDAYVRTLVAIEVGEANPNLVGISYHQTWTRNEIGTIEVDGNKYYLYEFNYAGGQLSDGTWRHKDGVLPAGETSYPNLSQVYLMSEATNEDCEALDGNDNGRLDILVLSQAVQTNGFADAQTALDTAFGDITTTNHPWVNYDFSNSVVTEEELDEKLSSKGTAKLESDIVLTDVVTIPFGKTVTMDLNGHNLSLKDNGGVMIGFNSTFIIEGEGNVNFELFYIVNVFGEGIAKGGTYIEDPSTHLTIADGYKVVDNGNGTWTVKPE